MQKYDTRYVLTITGGRYFSTMNMVWSNGWESRVKNQESRTKSQEPRAKNQEPRVKMKEVEERILQCDGATPGGGDIIVASWKYNGT